MSFTTLDTKELRDQFITNWSGDSQSKIRLLKLFNDNPKMFDAEKSYFYLNRDKSISLYLDNNLYNFVNFDQEFCRDCKYKLIDGDEVLTISELKTKYNVVDIIIDKEEPVVKATKVAKVAIVGTHNFRLQCFFTKMMYDKVNIYTNLKFKNCAMIRCYYNNNKIEFEMIYDGELSSDEKNDVSKYWTKDDFNKAGHYMAGDLPNQTEIVLIRHGKGIHNGVSLFTKMLDPKKYIDASLTREGVGQAERAADAIIDYYKIFTDKKIVFGASHLKRSQQTVAVMEEFILKEYSPIVIVPCTHELLYTSDGNCDGSIKQIGVTPENTPSCDYKKNLKFKVDQNFNIEPEICKQIKDLCDNGCKPKKTQFFEVDWTQYLEFYTKKGGRGRCRKTDMITQIVNCLLKRNTF